MENSLICPKCGRIAYWYEVKYKGQPPNEYSCCKRANLEYLDKETLR